MKHTVTVTIDTPRDAWEELRFLVQTSDRLALQAHRQIADAVDFDQLKAGLDTNAAAKAQGVRLVAFANGLGMAFGADWGDTAGLIAAARNEIEKALR